MSGYSSSSSSSSPSPSAVPHNRQFDALAQRAQAAAQRIQATHFNLQPSRVNWTPSPDQAGHFVQPAAWSQPTTNPTQRAPQPSPGPEFLTPQQGIPHAPASASPSNTAPTATFTWSGCNDFQVVNHADTITHHGSAMSKVSQLMKLADQNTNNLMHLHQEVRGLWKECKANSNQRAFNATPAAYTFPIASMTDRQQALERAMRAETSAVVKSSFFHQSKDFLASQTAFLAALSYVNTPSQSLGPAIHGTAPLRLNWGFIYCCHICGLVRKEINLDAVDFSPCVTYRRELDLLGWNIEAIFQKHHCMLAGVAVYEQHFSRAPSRFVSAQAFRLFDHPCVCLIFFLFSSHPPSPYSTSMRGRMGGHGINCNDTPSRRPVVPRSSLPKKELGSTWLD